MRRRRASRPRSTPQPSRARFCPRASRSRLRRRLPPSRLPRRARSSRHRRRRPRHLLHPCRHRRHQPLRTRPRRPSTSNAVALETNTLICRHTASFASKSLLAVDQNAGLLRASLAPSRSAHQTKRSVRPPFWPQGGHLRLRRARVGGVLPMQGLALTNGRAKSAPGR